MTEPTDQDGERPPEGTTLRAFDDLARAAAEFRRAVLTSGWPGVHALAAAFLTIVVGGLLIGLIR